jgi:hypothetical protein
MNDPLAKNLLWLAAIIAMAGGFGCESEKREPEGRRVSVRAPYTDVDVFIPDDDDDDVEVDVDVDD